MYPFTSVKIFLIPLSITFLNPKFLGFVFLRKKAEKQYYLVSEMWQINCYKLLTALLWTEISKFSLRHLAYWHCRTWSVMECRGVSWRMAAWSRFCNIDVMGDVKRLRQENLRLKDQIQALSEEVEQMKLLLQQSSIQLACEPPTTANATPSREGEKSLSFLSDKRNELILFKKKCNGRTRATR